MFVIICWISFLFAFAVSGEGYNYSSGLVPGCATERPYSPFLSDGLNVSTGLLNMGSTQRCYLGNTPQKNNTPGDAPLSVFEYGTAAAVIHHNMSVKNAFMDCRDIGVHIGEIAEECDLNVPEGRQHGRKVTLAEGYSGPVDQHRIFVVLDPSDPPFSIVALRDMGIPFFREANDFFVYIALENVSPTVGNIRHWNGPEGWGEDDAELRYGKPEMAYAFPKQNTGSYGEKKKMKRGKRRG
ncbi:MAG: hypothetical protein M1835_006568 [Candelina submexicana]|nr:MAG: hypothetical protein M1835_006568 [Candelina submexicana]